MSAIPSYRSESGARWTQRRRGIVECDQTDSAIEFSAPAEFQGDAGYWTPEHLLLSAVAACFVTTFRAIADLSKFEFISLEVSASGTLGNVDGTLQFQEVILRPLLTIAREAQHDRALRLLEKTEHGCLISRSLKPKVTLKPLIEVAEHDSMESVRVDSGSATEGAPR